MELKLKVGRVYQYTWGGNKFVYRVDKITPYEETPRLEVTEFCRKGKPTNYACTYEDTSISQYNEDLDVTEIYDSPLFKALKGK